MTGYAGAGIIEPLWRLWVTTDLAAQKDTRGGTMSQRQADTSMADNRITKARIRNHWQYGWWKYLLMVVLVIMSVSIGFSVTAYRPPEDRRIEVYLCHGWANAEQFQADLWPALLEVARLRLQYPEMSLEELGMLCDPPLGKSGVNHRMRRLERMAAELDE